MKMTKEMISKINEEFTKDSFYNSDIDLKLISDFSGIGIYRTNWNICKLNDLSNLIEQLTILKDTIQNETGIEF